MGLLGVSFLLICLLFIAAQAGFALNTASLLENGQCEEFEGSPLACQSVLRGSWSQVWTAPSLGITQEVLNANLYAPVNATENSFFSSLDVLSALPYKHCAEAYAQLICPTFFAPCLNRSSDEGRGYLPQPVCRSVCEAVNTACRAARHGADLIDCANKINPLTGGQMWPDDNSTGATCTTAPANLPADDDETGSIKLKYACPPPLVFEPDIPDQISGLGCSSTCRTKRYLLVTAHEFQVLYDLVTIISWISFVLICVLLVTFLVFPSMREYPIRIVCYTALGLFFGHLPSVGASFIGLGYTCQSRTELAYGISYCSFYAWCLYFGSLATTIFWAYQSFVAFYNLVVDVHHDRNDRKYEWLCVSVGWGYSLVVSILLATLPIEASGSRGAFPWCFQSLKTPQYRRDLDWGLLWWVVILTAIMVSFFVTVSVIQLIRRSVRSKMEKLKVIKLFSLMTLFSAYFLLATASILAITFYNQTGQDHRNAQVAEWNTCVLTWATPTFECPKPHANVQLFIWEAISYPLAGTVLFICFFVLREKTWQCWFFALRNVYYRRPFYYSIPGTELNST